MSNIQIHATPTFKKIGGAFGMFRFGEALQRAITKYAFAIRDEAVKETPVDTGRLRASIMTSIGTLQAMIGPHVNYAEWIHEGVRKLGGQMVYLKGLGRAGTPPGGKPFMRLGLEKVEAKRDQIISKELTDEIRGTFKRSGLAVT